MKVKICGLTEPHGLTAAIEGGADFVGFVFVPSSPRYVTPEIAQYLASYVPAHVKRVGLFVDPNPDMLQHILQQGFLDMVQLHGFESIDSIKEIKSKYGLPIMKAVNIAQKSDISAAQQYEEVADWMLFDAKAESSVGGTGQTFDWHILKDYPHQKLWMLAGGLNAGNIGDALKILSPTAVDVSSGVEVSRGVKDPEKIKKFIEIVKALPRG